MTNASKMKTIKLHIVSSVPKSNLTITETDKIDSPITSILDQLKCPGLVQAFH